MQSEAILLIALHTVVAEHVKGLREIIQVSSSAKAGFM